MKQRGAKQVDEIFEKDEVDAVLRDSFYGKKRRHKTNKRTKAAKKADHYDVICISLYTEDLERLDAMVAELKKKGHRKVSRSALIRFALDRVKLGDFPRAY